MCKKQKKNKKTKKQNIGENLLKCFYLTLRMKYS